MNEDAGAQSVSGWATSISAGPNESGQTLTYELSFDPDFVFGPEFFTVAPSIAPDGTLSFTPGFIGVAHMIVHLKDSGGSQNGGTDVSADQKFTITINP